MEVNMNMIYTHVLEKLAKILISVKPDELLGKQELFDWLTQRPTPEFDNSWQDNTSNIAHKNPKHNMNISFLT